MGDCRLIADCAKTGEAEMRDWRERARSRFAEADDCGFAKARKGDDAWRPTFGVPPTLRGVL